MRDFTEYEKEKWFDGGEVKPFKFNSPEFLSYGDEIGEAFDVVERATTMRDYGLSDEFVIHAMEQVLTLYYDQIVFYYQDQYDDPEDHGLPSVELFESKAQELGVELDTLYYHNIGDDARRLWDWAMEWREENKQASEDRLREKRLREELERIEARKK